MKHVMVVLTVLLFTLQSRGAAAVYEGFNYPVDPAPQYLGGRANPLPWTKAGSGIDAVISAGSLSITGLPAPVGNSVALSGAAASNGVVDRIGLGGSGSFNSGSLYYSLILRATDLAGLATSGGFIAGFNQLAPDSTSGVTRAVCRLQIRATDATATRFNLGIRNDVWDGDSANIAWDTTEFTAGSTPIFVVARYTFNTGSILDDVASLWINPNSSTFGVPSAPATSLVSSGCDLTPLQSFFLRQVNVAPNLTVVDEVRIGTSWADVTPYEACAAPTVTSVSPASRMPGQVVSGVIISGTNFIPGTSARLTRAGQPDIVAQNVNVLDTMRLSCDLDLTNAAVGKWTVVATSPCGSRSLVDGFQVTADEAVVINGRRLFPIIFSPGPPINGLTPSGKNALQELRDAGATVFRLPRTTDWNDQIIAEEQAALDAAVAHDMYSWINLRELSHFAAGDTAKEAALREMVNRFKNHPGLGLWKNLDESAWAGIPADDMIRGYQIIRQEDPNHPVVQTHAPRLTVEQLRPYNGCADILALDIYPVGYPPGANSLEPNKEISMVGDWTQFLREVGEDSKPSMMILQIAWSGVTKPDKTLRFPTFRQQRFMSYQAIINGARGLMYFGGNATAALTPDDAQRGWNWRFWNRVLKQVVEELGNESPLAPALIAPASGLAITVTGASDVEFCVREVGADLFILACKREGATVNVEFSGLPAWAGVGELLYEEPRKVTATNGRFTDWFGPFEVHVYRFHNSN
jgi:hypothetical protein